MLKHMSIQSYHPQYSVYSPDWVLCRDAYNGERVVKNKGTTYLPATAGMIADGMQNTKSPGYLAYEAYKTRAVYHEYMKEAVETMIGIMWSKDPVIELPAAMEAMLETATIKGETMYQLLRRINEQQLITGRLGLLLDLPTTPQPVNSVLPYIAMYEAENIINWDDGRREEVEKDTLNLVVLDESEYQRTEDFEWEWEHKYRVLALGDVAENELTGVYKVGVFIGTQINFSEEKMEVPVVVGNPLTEIPFVFVNSKDIVATPDNPPLAGIARLCMAIYRGEADYRQSLYLQGQDTLVIIGATGDDDYRVGAGTTIQLPTGGDAKFVGVSSSGLAEQRQALENDKMVITSKAGQLIDTRSKQKESGAALEMRIGAQTATLNQIAITGAGALEKILKSAAEWLGLNPEEVSVMPNLDFADVEMTPAELVQYMSAKNLGAPIAKSTIHEIMRSRGVTEKTLEEELAEIEAEAPALTGTEAGGNAPADQDS